METLHEKSKINIQIIETNKYKTEYIRVRYVLPFEKEKAQARCLLSMMLANRTAKHPTNQAMTNYLDFNYGLNASTTTYNIGKNQIIEIRTSGVSDFYIANDSFNKQLDLIEEMVFHPLLDENGLFDQSLYEEMRMVLESKIVRRIDDPQNYAMEQACKQFGSESYFSYSVHGEKQDLASLSREKVREAYEEMLHKAYVNITIVTDKNKEETYANISKRKFAIDTLQTIDTMYEVNNIICQDKEEERDIDQTSLLMGWYTSIRPTSPLYFALKLANIIIGGDTTSFMFKEIREKRSLCYSCYSTFYSLDGFLIAYSGISYENKQLVEKCILEIVDRMINETIEEELEIAKKIYVNALYGQNDSPTGMMNFEFQNDLLQLNRDINKMIEAINQVSEVDIKKAMMTLQYCGSYTLKEMNYEE